jgi:hypothetical protein
MPTKNPPPQNGCRLKSVFVFKSTGFTSSTFPIQPNFSQNQLAAITLNTSCPRTLVLSSPSFLPICIPLSLKIYLKKNPKKKLTPNVLNIIELHTNHELVV